MAHRLEDTGMPAHAARQRLRAHACNSTGQPRPDTNAATSTPCAPCHFVGLPGGLKERTAIDQWDRDPTKILKDAVKGMLPKNKTQVYRLEKLKIFPEAEHPFTDFDLVSCSPK